MCKKLIPILLAIMSACTPNVDIPFRAYDPDTRFTMSTSRETSFTGRGNGNEVLETLTVSSDEPVRLKKMSVHLNSDDGDVTAIKAICNGKIIGKIKVKNEKKDYKIRCRCILDSLSHLELCADIADDAREGGKVSADIVGIRTGLKWETVPSAGQGSREILLRRVKVLEPGMFGSDGYRIPAIAALDDGALLITTDRRKFNDRDLPEDIDIIVQRSNDNGRTWSEPAMLAEGRGYGKGFGDAALVLTESGNTVCAYSGGAGVWGSTLENPQRNYIVASRDGGITWSEPFDCTSMLWGPEAANEECRTCHSAFFASGSGLRLKKGRYAGRIMFIAAVHSQNPWRFDNYAVYSDDGGTTWNVSGRAFIGGDEAKAVELPDGRILMSVRRSGERGFNTSCDGGITWNAQGLWSDICTNACDGDIINVGDTLLLHSLPNDMARRNVSVFVSRDNGETWPYVKSICPYESVYSSITELPDGTIGAYLEENPRTGFEMWYMNFSIDWLLNKEQQAYGKSE